MHNYEKNASMRICWRRSQPPLWSSLKCLLPNVLVSIVQCRLCPIAPRFSTNKRASCEKHTVRNQTKSSNSWYQGKLPNESSCELTPLWNCPSAEAVNERTRDKYTDVQRLVLCIRPSNLYIYSCERSKDVACSPQLVLSSAAAGAALPLFFSSWCSIATVL